MNTTRAGIVTVISFGRPDPSEDDAWIEDGHTYVTIRLDDDKAAVSGGHTTITWDEPAAEHVEGEQAGPTDAEVRAAARVIDPEAWETDLSEERGADRHMIRGRRGQSVALARAALVAAREVSGR